MGNGCVLTLFWEIASMRDVDIKYASAASAQALGPQSHVQNAPVPRDDVDQRYAEECEYLARWQGPSPERARLMREIEARYRKSKEAVAKPFVHLPGR